jgi:hypothetical protein
MAKRRHEEPRAQDRVEALHLRIFEGEARRGIGLPTESGDGGEIGGLAMERADDQPGDQIDDKVDHERDRQDDRRSAHQSTHTRS